MKYRSEVDIKALVVQAEKDLSVSSAEAYKVFLLAIAVGLRRKEIDLLEWFAELTMKQIRRGAYRSVAQLKAGIQQFIDAHHDDPKPFVWTKSADEILASIARFAQRTADARAMQQMSRTMVTGH